MLELMETFHLWEYQLRIYRVYQEYRIELCCQGRYYLHQKSFSSLENCVLWTWLELNDRLEMSLTDNNWLPLSHSLSLSEIYHQRLVLPTKQDRQGTVSKPRSSVPAAI